jgi:hypothetical protein
VSGIDLTAPEVQAAIEAAVSEKVAGLKANNEKLIKELRDARKGQQIDPADLERVEQERDQIKQQLTEANKALTKATKDLDAANKARADIEGAFHGSLRDAALTEELTKAGVTNPVHLKAAKALLGSQLSVVADGDARVVKAGDKAVGDFIKEWAGGDEGKHFTAPSSSNGAGTQHSRQHNSSAPSVTRQAFDAMTPAAQHEHIQKQGVVTDA